MSQLGKRVLDLTLAEPLSALPAELADWPLTLQADGAKLRYTFTSDDEHIPRLLARLSTLGIGFRDLETHRSSLEDIFVDLIGERA
jgi:ABC-2 type transport system ATP-binding protein